MDQGVDALLLLVPQEDARIMGDLVEPMRVQFAGASRQVPLHDRALEQRMQPGMQRCRGLANGDEIVVIQRSGFLDGLHCNAHRIAGLTGCLAQFLGNGLAKILGHFVLGRVQ